jgi:hypothetical protein
MRDWGNLNQSDAGRSNMMVAASLTSWPGPCRFYFHIFIAKIIPPDVMIRAFPTLREPAPVIGMMSAIRPAIQQEKQFAIGKCLMI